MTSRLRLNSPSNTQHTQGKSVTISKIWRQSCHYRIDYFSWSFFFQFVMKDPVFLPTCSQFSHVFWLPPLFHCHSSLLSKWSRWDFNIESSIFSRICPPTEQFLDKNYDWMCYLPLIYELGVSSNDYINFFTHFKLAGRCPKNKSSCKMIISANRLSMYK